MFDWLLSAMIQLDKFFSYFDNLPHQRAAIQKLQEDMPAELLAHDAEWFQIWKAGGMMSPIPVPYYNQHHLPDGQRKCLTSTLAMVAAYHGAVATQKEYDDLRERFGDTTDIGAQVRTLQELGLRPEFVMDGTEDLIEAELDAGRVVAVGWLHKGDISTGRPPEGFGHWGVVIGYTEKFFILMDPRGEYDLQTGELMKPGKGNTVFYERNAFLFRWHPEGPGNGWAILVDPLPPLL